MEIAVVGPHRTVRVGLRLLVEAHPAWRVVSETSVDGGLRQLPVAEHPDVILVDVDPPGPPPGRVLARLAGRFPDAPIVAIGTPDGRAHARRALIAGAAVYVTKETVDTLLVTIIEEVAPCRPSA